MLKGYKTYILGILGFIWAVFGWVQGYIDPAMAQQVIWGSLTAMALRAGIAKNGNKTLPPQ